MSNLQTAGMSFAYNAPMDGQHLGPYTREEKRQGGHLSTSSDTSGDDLEAGFLETRLKKSRLCAGLMEYARECKRRFRSSPQPQGVLADFYSVTLGALVILILIALLIYFNVHLRRQIPHNDIQRIVAAWGAPGSPTQAEAHYPTDFSRDVIPIPCHSHNDYWRKVPLYDALAAGCTGVEADVWLTGNDLLVGHSIGSLTSARSLTNLYIDPLLSILNHQNPPLRFQNSTSSSTEQNSTAGATPLNGVFEMNAATSLTLLIDIKANGTAIFPILIQQLQPLRSRGYLTYFNGSSLVPGPITVVASGNAPFDLITNSNTSHRDVFFDAPLDQLWGDDDDDDDDEQKPSSNTELYTRDNSYYASVDFEKAIGRLWHGTLAPRQVDTILGQARAARVRGLRARYWNTPAWPVAVREHVWDVLEREGVGMLNVDDLVGASRRNWGN